MKAAWLYEIMQGLRYLSSAPTNAPLGHYCHLFGQSGISSTGKGKEDMRKHAHCPKVQAQVQHSLRLHLTTGDDGKCLGL